MRGDVALIERLKAARDGEQSYFRRHLLGEDIARLERLAALAARELSEAEYLVAASRLGWTADDRRTPELQPTLRPLVLAFKAAVTGRDRGTDDELATLWRAFDAHRIERLVGCLSRAPRPE